ncbi:hypothetical protein WDU94_002558 [Cyamophila willieti]
MWTKKAKENGQLGVLKNIGNSPKINKSFELENLKTAKVEGIKRFWQSAKDDGGKTPSIDMNPKYYRIYENSVENPFANYTIEDNSFLDDLIGRSLCAKCNRSRKYFCYSCNRPLPEFAHKIPKVKLPFKLDIVKHERETEGKSTSVHAAIIAPDDVTVYIFPHNVPDYSKNNEKTVLIYPSKTSMTLDEFIAHHSANTTRSHCEEANGSSSSSQVLSERKNCDIPVPFERAVIIDATWPQSRSIMAHSTVHHLPCITLQKRMSYFWRHQKNSPRWYLATIEAIHQLLNEVHPNNNGRYDNLLFYFEFMYRKIHTLYSYDKLLAYQRKMNPDSQSEEKLKENVGKVTDKLGGSGGTQVVTYPPHAQGTHMCTNSLYSLRPDQLLKFVVTLTQSTHKGTSIKPEISAVE